MNMTTLIMPRSTFDEFDGDDNRVCVFCDTLTDLPYCVGCQEYKGLMTIAEWEAYTGETWEDE